MKHRAMVDGMRGGTRLETAVGSVDIPIDNSVRSSIQVLSAEADKVKKILRLASKSGRDINEKGEITVMVRSRSIIKVTLRRDKNDGTRWYLNMDGNPLTFLTGRNVYGWARADKQIVAVFKRCMKGIEDKATEKARARNTRADELKFPQRLWDQVEQKQIHLNHLEFATYTKPLRDKKKILNAWRYMFSKSVHLPNAGGKHEFLADMLNVLVNLEYENSFSLSTLRGERKFAADGTLEPRKVPKAKVVMFMAYDKEEELREAGQEEAIEPDVEVPEWEGQYKYREEDVPEDIKDRLRLEIALTSVWFSSRGIRNLAELVDFVQRAYGGKWEQLIQTEMTKLMERTCLVEMWRFDGRPVLEAARQNLRFVPGFGETVPTEAWLSMLEARSEFGVTKRHVISKLSEDKTEYLRELNRGAKLKPLSYANDIWPDPDTKVYLEMTE